MARSWGLDDQVRPVRRWVHTTPWAIEAVELAAAVALAAVVLGALTIVADLGLWSLALASLPVVNQIRAQVRSVARRRLDARAVSPATTLGGADLAALDLSAADLRGRDLADARLTGTILTTADLGGADLTDAVLRKADLRFASLDRTGCRGADLGRARLVEASLDGADARAASFDRADLRHASLVGANLLGAGFRGADVRGADFTGAKLAADALSDAIVDQTTVLADGSSGDPVVASTRAELRAGWSVVVGGIAVAVARPALQGLAAASVATGAVAAVETSGGGLGQELAIVTRSDPGLDDLDSRDRLRFPVRPATGGDIDRADRATDTGAVAGDEGRSPTDSGTAFPIDGPGEGDGAAGAGAGGTSTAAGILVDPPLPTLDGPTPGEGPVGDDALADAGLIQPTVPPSDTDPDTTASTDPTVPTETPTAAGDTDDPGGDADPDTETAVPPLTEAERPPVAQQVTLRQVQIVVATGGGGATVTSQSSLGQLDPRVVDGQEGWELGLPSGEVRVQVLPSSDGVTTACRILVDGAERSFQSGLAGQTSTCLVDLDPVGG